MEPLENGWVELCRTCRYHRPHDPSQGECRYHAPVDPISTNVYVWPRTRSDDWCGKWAPPSLINPYPHNAPDPDPR